MCTNIWHALCADKPMIFMASLRQNGKTTLAEMISRQRANRLYTNWDVPADRARLIRNFELAQIVVARYAHGL